MTRKFPALAPSLLATAVAAAILTPIAGPAPAAQAAATTYYVDAVNGNDKTTGKSPDTAFRTLDRVNRVAFAAGDTVLFRAGQTWTGRLNVSTTMSVSSWDTAPTPPTIAGGKTGPCINVTGAGADIGNIRVTGCRTAGIALRGTGQRVHDVVAEGNNVPGVLVDNGAQDAVVSHSTFTNNAYGLYLSGSDILVTDDTFTGNGAAVVVSNAQGVEVDHNTSADDGTFARLRTTDASDATTNVTVSYNRHTSSAAGGRFVTLHGAGGTSVGPVTGTRLWNNTARLTGTDSAAVVCTPGCTTAVLSEFRGNVLSSTAAAFTTDGATGRDNIFFGGAPTMSGAAGYTYGPGEVSTDPMFADPSTGDLRLQAGSPAIDRVGSLSDAVSTSDLAGTEVWTGTTAVIDGDGDGTRQVDAGAYEAPAAPPPPAPAPTPTPTPTPALKPALRGLVVTQPQQQLADVPYAEFASIKIKWNQVEPVDDQFDWSAITDTLKAYDGQSGRRFVRFRVRILAGIHSPTWTKGAAVNGPNPSSSGVNNNCGSGISVYPDSANGDQGCAPRFWRTDFQAEYLELMTAFAARFEADPQLVEVVNSACSTIYAESFILGAEDLEDASGPSIRTTSVDRLGAEGYTKAAHDACIRNTTKSLMDLFPTTRISMAGHNAWQQVWDDPADGTDFKVKYGDWASERVLWDDLRASYGNRLVIEDHGLKSDGTFCEDPTAAQASGSWYCYLAAMPGTATHGWQFTAGTTGWMPIAADRGVRMGACFLEFASFDGLTADQRKATHEALLANCPNP